MPRLTRSKKGAPAIHEDNLPAAEIPLPPSPSNNATVRLPLNELESLNLEETVMPAAVEDVAVALEALKKPKGKPRKVKGGRKVKKDKKDAVELSSDKMLASEADAVKAACDELMKGNGGGSSSSSVVDDDRPTTPPSEAVLATRKNLAQEVEIKVSEEKTTSEKISEDSFVQEIVSRSPAKTVTRSEEFIQPSALRQQTDGDSFVDQIISRSPVKRRSRIEDSVEALDALEEALEQVDKAVEKPRAISKSKKITPKTSTVTKKTPIVTTKAIHPRPRPTTKAASVSTKPVVKSKKPVTSTVATAQPAAARPMAVQRPSNSPASHTRTVSTVTASTAAKSTPKPRPSSVSIPPSAAPLPHKSTKPPTRPSFSLPGEAVAARLKAQREARVAREAEAAEAAKEFKAKPVKISKAPKLMVKGTKASAARMSSVREEGDGDVASHKRGVSFGVVSKKRVSTLPPLPIPAAKSTPTATATRKPSAATQSTIPGRQPSFSTATNASKGKEVFARGRTQEDDAVKLRKEKEDAAKKARAEAAERGRLASKEWAEKQRKKMMAEKAKKLISVERVAEAVSV